MSFKSERDLAGVVQALAERVQAQFLEIGTKFDTVTYRLGQLDQKVQGYERAVFELKSSNLVLSAKITQDERLQESIEHVRMEERDRMLPWLLIPWMIIMAYLLFQLLSILIRGLIKLCEKSAPLEIVPPQAPSKGMPFSEYDGAVQKEAYVSGSDYIPCKTYPGFQCGVYWAKDRVDGKLRVVYRGNAFWAGDYLYTNLHVVGTDPQQIIYLVNENDQSKVVELTSGDFTQLGDLDAVAIPHAKLAKKFNVLGLKKGSTPPVLLKGTQMAKIHARGAYTMGTLSVGFDNPGDVIYEGSTTHGYSGSAYFNNNMIYGLHVGSTTKGVGYDIAYLNAIAKRKFEVTKEDSWEDFLADVDDYCARTKRKIKYVQSSWDPSEYRFEVRGFVHQFNLDSEDLKRMHWDNFVEWSDSDEVVEHRRGKRRHDEEAAKLPAELNLTKEGLQNDDTDSPSPDVQTAEILVDVKDEVTVKIVKEPLIEAKQVFPEEPISEPSVIPTAGEIGKMSLVDIEERFNRLEQLLLTKLSCQTPIQPNTGGQILTPVQPVEVSPDTSTDIKPVSKRQRDLERRMLKQYGIDLSKLSKKDGQSLSNQS